MQAYMDFMMKILYALENLRCGFLDTFFSLVTMIGEETFFLVIALIVFWCVDKRRGYLVLLTGLVGTVANQALKLMFKIPRPWVYDTSFSPVEGSIEEATGYSFPSGHTQNAAGTLGSLAKTSKSKPIRWILIVVIALVSFSRMYLGVHTLADVAVSILIAVLLIFVLSPIFESEQRFNKAMPYVCAASVLLSLGLLLYVFLMNREGVDEHNLYSGMKNASTLFGCTLALIPVYFVDRYCIHFETKAPWYVQIIKLAVGFGGVLLIKSVLASPLVSLFGNEFVARGVRYFLIVMFAGVIWPLAFRPLSKIKVKFLDELPSKIKGAFK